MCQGTAKQQTNFKINNNAAVSTTAIPLSTTNVVLVEEGQEGTTTLNSTTTTTTTTTTIESAHELPNSNIRRIAGGRSISLRQRARTLSASTTTVEPSPSSPVTVVLPNFSDHHLDIRGRRSCKKRRLSSVDYFRDEHSFLRAQQQTVLLVTQPSERDLVLLMEEEAPASLNSDLLYLTPKISNKKSIINDTTTKTLVTSTVSNTVFETTAGPILEKGPCFIVPKPTKQQKAQHQRAHNLKSLIMASLSTFGLVVLLGNCFVFVLGGSGAANQTATSANTTFFEPQSMLWSKNQQHGSLRGTNITPYVANPGQIELDAYGRPSENQLRREVLRNLSMENFRSFVLHHGHRHPEEEEEDAEIQNVQRQGSRKLHSAGGGNKKQRNAASSADRVLSSGASTGLTKKKVAFVGAVGSHDDENSPDFFKVQEQHEETSSKKETSAATAVVAQGSSFLVNESTTTTAASSLQPSQFSEVDEAVESLTLDIELSRNRRIAKRIGCHWVLGKEAASLEEENDLFSKEVDTESSKSNSNVIEARDAKKKRARHLRHNDNVVIVAKHSITNKRSSLQKAQDDTLKKSAPSSEHKPHIILHHEDGETKAWDQQRR